jgi:hypothetical protein
VPVGQVERVRRELNTTTRSSLDSVCASAAYIQFPKLAHITPPLQLLGCPERTGKLPEEWLGDVCAHFRGIRESMLSSLISTVMS